MNLQGKPVALWRSSLRFLLLTLTPATFLFDLMWLADDPNRQTLRDRIAETYVVRSLLLPDVPRSGATRDG